jgi:hypothetical protein
MFVAVNSSTVKVLVNAVTGHMASTWFLALMNFWG